MASTAPARHFEPERLNLARQREQSGISLRAISEATKISMRFLEAIEAEEFGKLPGGVFTTSYLRQYAQAIGFPVEDLLAHYHRKMGLDSEPPSPGTRRETARGGLFRSLTGSSLF
jgi:cytoskeleton protein RodZ